MPATRAKEEAEAEVSAAKAYVDAAKADVDAAKADVDASKAEYIEEASKFFLFRRREKMRLLFSSWQSAQERLQSEQEVLTASQHRLARAINPPPVPQENASVERWFLVAGAIQRPYDFAGCRHKVIQLSVGGYYPRDKPDVDHAFEARDFPNNENLRLLFFSVVFENKEAAKQFNGKLDAYVSGYSSRGLQFYDVDVGSPCPAPPKILSIDPYPEAAVIYISCYQPRDEDAAAPEDSPVFDVEYQSQAETSSYVTEYLDSSTVEYRLQRIEADLAFARSPAESAHIFPRAKCKGVYEWLSDNNYNRLALSSDGHASYDGTGRGRGKRAKTTPQVTLQPLTYACSPDRAFEQKTFPDDPQNKFYVIPVKLWCKTQQIANNWKTFLPNEATCVQEARFYSFSGLRIYCAVDRKVTLKTELMQQPNGTFVTEFLDKVPGLDNVADAWSFSADDATLSVTEVMEKCLQWNYQDTMQTWQLEGG